MNKTTSCNYFNAEKNQRMYFSRTKTYSSEVQILDNIVLSFEASRLNDLSILIDNFSWTISDLKH